MPERASLNSPNAAPQRNPWPTVIGFALTRLLGNLIVRAPYVFITQLSKGLGVSVDTMTLVLGIRELGGLGAPIAGRLVDRGRGVAVIIGGGVAAGVACLLAASSWFPLFVVAMFVAGLAKNWVDLSQNAWVGHEVPISKRARVIGLIETTWAGSFLLGVPVLGWAVNQWGWRAAFVLTGPLFTLLAIGSGLRLQARNDALARADHDPAEPAIVSPPHADSTDHAGAHRTLEALGNPKRLKPAIWIYFAMQPFAQMLVFAVNGDWFVEHLGMTTGGLSTATAVLGVSELIGTLFVMGFADRLGPLRVGATALLASAFPLVALTLVEPTIFWGVAMLVVMDFCVELSFVSVLPVVTELNIKNRGKAVSQAFMLMMVARAISSAIAGIVYTTAGFDTTLLISAAVAVIGGLALVWAQLGRDTSTPDRPRPALAAGTSPEAGVGSTP